MVVEVRIALIGVWRSLGMLVHTVATINQAVLHFVCKLLDQVKNLPT